MEIMRDRPYLEAGVINPGSTKLPRTAEVISLPLCHCTRHLTPVWMEGGQRTKKKGKKKANDLYILSSLNALVSK